MSGIKDRIRKKKREKLLDDGGEEEGISNPSMDEEIAEITQPSGTDSSPEMEAAEADALVKTLKTKRTKKKKELAQEVISPKDDLARQLKEAKKKSKAKLDESVRQELEETAVSEVADDGTLPMPEEEGVPEEPGSPKEEGEEESRIKKLRKKKEPVEETPIEGPPEEAPAEEVEEEEEKEEPPPRPPSPEEAEAETERKTPRMASMRAKMKERLAKAKEEAMTEVKEQAKESRRERRLQRDKTQKTRFDTDQPRSKYDEIEAEELERMTEEKRKQREERKKKLAEKRKEGVYMPSSEEAYDFFTRVWEPESEDEEEPVEKAETEKKEKKEGEEEAKEGEEEAKEGEEPKEEGEEGEVEPKPGKAEDEQPLLGKEEEEIGYALTVMSKADYPDPDALIQEEEKVLFYPSSAEIPAQDKVAEEMEVRCLEEEGFYVGTRPSTSGWNQNRMEHRLLKEIEKGQKTSRKWFGEDGKLLALPDPLRAQPSRPPVAEEVEPYLQTVFKKALIREFDSRYIDGTTEGGGHYQLDVDINQICFSHHHLYSREHVLAQRLTQLYDQYIIRQKKNMTQYLGQKLKALKDSALHLQDHIAAHRSEHSIADRSNYERRLVDYKTEIRQARLQRDREEKTDRTLLKNMIHTWKEIRAQRDLQRFTNTPVKLQIRKEEVDKAQDQAAWKIEIEEEIEEVRDEHEREYRHKMLTYEEEMAKYQKQQQAKKEAEKRRRKKKGRRGSKQSRGSGLSGSGLEDYSEEAQRRDQEILDEADLSQPEPPEQFDENTIREQVKAKAMESRRRPGEPKLDLELSNTATITPTSDCPTGEQRRRDDVSKCKVFVKILFNNKEVSRTNAKPLTQDFKVNYGQIYNMKIMQWPESISFQVYENVGLSTHMMAELCAPIPDTSVTVLSVQLEELEFSSDHRINHSHEGVGSGLPFSFGKGGQELLTLMTTGALTFSVAWAVDENAQALVPPTSTSNITSMFNHMKKMDPLAAIGATGVMDMKKLADWFYASRLDPNDPNNADIVYILRGKSGDATLLSPTEYFRLEQLMEEFDFVTDDDLQANKRFQLLQLRDEEVQEFRNYKQVPVYDREIPRDTFAEYERKKREEQKLRQMDDIESHRAAVKRFRQRIREQVMRRFRVQSHMKRWEDMVYEEAVPNIAILGTNLLKVFERKAPLKPRRKERKKVTAVNIKGDEVKILVNISRAQNVPIRMAAAAAGSGTMTARETDRKRTEELIEGTTVRPFIEVMFQHNSIRTSVGDGANPSFNEELEIPFKAPNDDFSPSNLQTISDSIFLNLFDEVVVDIQQDDRERGSTVHQRIEKKWLGSIKIPFTTVYFNGKIDGTFRVSAPPVLLGYLQESMHAGEADVGINKDIKTLLSMFVTIEPPLTQPEPAKERFTTNEDEKLMVYADEWQEQVSTRFMPKRDVKTFVTDTNFKSVFITRYFKAIKPPEELTNKGLSSEATSELVARYVSLIPFISDSMIFPGLCDIWNTCDCWNQVLKGFATSIEPGQPAHPCSLTRLYTVGCSDCHFHLNIPKQFLQMLSGDEEEHAILLVNYFLSLGKKAYLICGSAIPEGPTAYVLTEEASGYWIWNPSTGDHFRTQDTTSPLQTIGCLVNHENIWANIQQYDKPSQILYNLADTAEWEPIFSKRYPSPGLGSIQPDSLYYFPTDKDYVVELQEKIQSTLKNKIMDWRSRYITRWNRHCTQIMRKMLPVLEENCGKSVGEQHIHELEQSFSSYKVSGFPINMPFTEIDPIIETVYATGVHAQESSDVEFALAVYVHPYPNSVLSVWVYVASLMRMR